MNKRELFTLANMAKVVFAKTQSMETAIEMLIERDCWLSKLKQKKPYPAILKKGYISTAKRMRRILDRLIREAEKKKT